MAKKSYCRDHWAASALLACMGAFALSPPAHAGLDDGLVSYWKFDEGSGVTALDSVGTNDGDIIGATYTGGGADAAPVFGNADALRFDGISAEVSVPDAPSLNFGPSNDLTIAFWFKGEGARTVQHFLGKRIPFCSAQFNYQFATDSGGLHFNSANGPTFRVSTPVFIPINQWTHVAATYSSSTSTLRVFVDGEVKGEDTSYTLVGVNSEPLKIGTADDCIDSNRTLGLIDEVRIYNRALNTSEVKGLATGLVNVAIDVKPGSTANSINLDSAGVVPVAILSTTDFDAPAEVDPNTILLAGASVRMIGKGDRYQCSAEDVNADGLPDLRCGIETAEFLLQIGDSIAVLEASTYTGFPIRGEDSITIVPGS